MQAVTARETTLRVGPGSHYRAAPVRPMGATNSRVRRHTDVTIRRRSGSWSYVQITGTTNNREGWVPTRDLTVDAQRMGIIVNHRVRLRASPNSSARTLTRLNRNTEVTIISRGRGSSSGWTEVRAGKRTGWVRNIELENDTQMRRTRRAVTMRSGPGSNFGSIRNIRNGENITVLGRQGNWLQVRYKGRVGWIQNNRTSRTATRRIRSAGIQPLRREARAGSRTTWTNHLPRNTRVTVLGRDGRSNSGFTRVRIGNRTGWLWTSWLR